MMVVVLAGCGRGGDVGGVTVDDIEGDWQLVSGRSADGEVPILDTHRITLTIEGDQAGGTAACNSYGGRVTVSGSSVRFEELARTEMACDPPAAMESEAAYLGALQQVTTAEVTAEELVLTAGEEVELRFESLPPVETADVLDTTWQLESLLEGTGPDGTASSAAPAELVLASDGMFSGTTGCRSFEGEWREWQDRIQITAMSADGDCTDELADQDAHVLEVIGDDFRVQVEGQTLTVTSGDRGLMYRAADS
jgi:heat shock protein HslJ